MDFSLCFHPGELGVKGHCVYRQQDFSLEYIPFTTQSPMKKPDKLTEIIDARFQVEPSSPIFLIADTLTLCFDGISKKLTSLDAYTNKSLWSPSRLIGSRDPKDYGSLEIESLPIKESHISMAVNPRYEVAINEQWVRIVLSEDSPEAYYEVGLNLIAGLRQKMITDLFLLDLSIL